MEASNLNHEQVFGHLDNATFTVRESAEYLGVTGDTFVKMVNIQNLFSPHSVDEKGFHFLLSDLREWKTKMSNEKMYICVLDEVPDFMTPTLVAHAVLRHSLNDTTDRYKHWCEYSFRKCTVRVNRKEFDKIADLPNVVLSWESTTLNGEPSCVTIIANKGDYNVLKFAKLWKPNEYN